MHTQRQIESALRQVRALLGKAHQLEIAGDVEYADACGAVAANKLASAIRWADQADVVVAIDRHCPYCARVMSVWESSQQHSCDHCYSGESV